jgi:hypothetical protein
LPLGKDKPHPETILANPSEIRHLNDADLILTRLCMCTGF